MNRKTKVDAEAGKQEIKISREFDLPVELLFKAYVTPDIIAQWMGTQVLKMDSKKFGSYQLETKDAEGNVLFMANGVIHEFIPNEKITRTFEMKNTPYGVQLEFYEFEKLSDNTSRLNMHVIYESVSKRDGVMQLGFEQGVNMAHSRIQDVMGKLMVS